jgi:aryl-alcohol dehydrogenase-like predicted oxidoreductase
MGMSEFYGPADDESSLHVLEHAYDLGVRHFDTADMYGNGHNESLLAAFLQRRPDAFVATKFGIRRSGSGYDRRIDSSPAYLRKACEASLRRLGRETLDLYYVHRLAPDVPVEDTIGALSELIREGKVRHIGLCEVSEPTLRRAHSIHPITAVQSELSLWTREMEREVLPACGELGIAFVAYSPLGRGFLTGKVRTTEGLAEEDFRRKSPRFEAANLERNRGLLTEVERIAEEKGCSPAQLALAWVLGKGPTVFAIPGTRRVGRLEENWQAASLALTEEERLALERAMPIGAAHGDRYPEAGRVGLNA